MKIHRDFEELGKIKNPVVTTGSFDGVHAGHKTILRRIRLLADQQEGETVLITFFPHPRKVLYPDSAGKNLKMINAQEEKTELLRQTQLDHLIIINFTREFSQITSAEFVKNILVDKLGAKVIVVGFNHHFGHNRQGDYHYLYGMKDQYGFEVEEIPEQDIQNETVSSTKIRNAIQEGDIQKANAYLDQYYLVKGLLEDGDQRFKNFGFNTFRLIIEEKEKLLPPSGTYAISCNINSETQKGIAFIPDEPAETKSNRRHLQILFFNPVSDCRNKTVNLLFHKCLRKGWGHQNGDVKKILDKDLQKASELIY